MEFLKEVYERRKKYFDNLEFYLTRIKEIAEKEANDAEVYLYGSVLGGNYSIGLSDIDVAVVSDVFKDRDRKLDFFGKMLKEFFDSPFEFHVLSRKQWMYYKKFIKNFRKV
jgi:predicted nucleotidyltransferase